MAEGREEIFQFRITLQRVTPRVWRRIQVPSNLTFRELNLAVQMAMGWKNCHLHYFNIQGVYIFDHDHVLDFWGPEGSDVDEVDTYIRDFFKVIKQRAKYEYDFGDGWNHVIELESIEPAKPGEKYPKCIDGRRACPPENCGGPICYNDMLQDLKKPARSKVFKETTKMLEQLGYKSFDPAKFSCEGLFDEWGVHNPLLYNL